MYMNFVLFVKLREVCRVHGNLIDWKVCIKNFIEMVSHLLKRTYHTTSSSSNTSRLRGDVGGGGGV